LLDIFAILVAVALLLLVFVDRGGVVRLLLTLAFAFFVPGRAVVGNWPRMAEWSDVGMSVALSLAVLVVFSSCALWARYWHPLGLFQVEALLSLIALGVAVTRRRTFENEQRFRSGR
jgi:hypothetical protein